MVKQIVLLLMGMMAPLVAVSAFAFHFWHTGEPRRLLQPLHLSSRGSSTTSKNETLGSQRLDVGGRSIMDDILSRYDQCESKDWTKTRSYIYRASDRLTRKQVDEVLGFLDSTFPNDSALVQSILQSSPRILRRNVQSNLQPTVKFLQELYGTSLFREAISRNPDLLIASGLGYECKDDAVESFLSGHLRLSSVSISNLKETHPFVFQLPVQKIESVAHFLEGKLTEAGYDNEVIRRIVGKVVTSHPHLLGLSVDSNLQPRIEFLVETCGLAEKDVATLVKSSPGILGLSVEDNLRPTLEFLSNLLSSMKPELVGNDGDSREHLRKCILNHPQIMALSIKNLQTKVSYFDAIDALNPKRRSRDVSLAARIATRAPAVFSLSLRDNIIPTVEFLARVWNSTFPVLRWDESLNMQIFEPRYPPPNDDNEPLSRLLSEYPSILTLSLEGNIQPTLNFFNRTGYIALDQSWKMQHRPVREGVSQVHTVRGRYIAASLFNRLLPRWHFCISQQAMWRQVEADSIAMLPPLHILVGATDPKFCKHMGFDLQEYTTFRSSSVSRLKFASQFDTWLHTGRPIDV